MIRTLSLAVIAFVALTGTSFAQEGAAKVKATKLAGEIVKVELTDTAKSLTIKVEAKKAKEGAAPAAAEEKTLAITEKTKIVIDGKDAAATELKVGAKATCVLEADALVEVSVGAKAKKEKAEKKEGEAAH